MTARTFVKLQSKIYRERHNDLGAAWALYLYMCDTADYDSGTLPWYSDKKAAHALGVPQRTIKSWRHKLVQADLISCELNNLYIKNWCDPRYLEGPYLQISYCFRDPVFRKQLGPAWALYFWMLENADWETCTINNYRDAEAAKQLGVRPRLVAIWRRHLIENNIVHAAQGLHCLKVTVLAWAHVVKGEEGEAIPVELSPVLVKKLA